LGAMFYDTLLLIALLMAISAAFLLVTKGEAVTSAGAPLLYFYRLVLAVSSAAFFVYFWTRRGRTLGMQVWRLRIESLDGALPTWRDALMRLALAIVPWLPGFAVLAVGVQLESNKELTLVGAALLVLIPLNYCAAWWDPERRAWHDRWLRTRIVKR